MLRKIDVGQDKNVFVIDPKVGKRPQLKFLADDIPRTPDESISEARKIGIPNWINSEPLITGHVDEDGQAYLFFINEILKKRVINLEIWDYTLLPCRRSMAYSQEWHRRYGHSGLMTIGIHAPMFEFGRERKNIMDVVRELSIPYPIVMDNEFEIWRSLENRFWPRRLLLDGTGKTHLDVVGEGQYVEIEQTIQTLLRQLSPGLPCPPILKPLKRIDDSSYKIPPTSSEFFFGSKKQMRLGNQQAFKGVEEVIFKEELPAKLQLDAPYLTGGWFSAPESIYGSPHKGELKITTNFAGTDVYLVARSRSKNPSDVPQGTKIGITVDRKSLTEDKVAGTHVTLNEIRRSVLFARDPKLYHIATHLDPIGTHELTLTIEEDTLHTIEIYGLFFEHGL